VPEDVGPLILGARVAAPFGSALATGLVASLDPPPTPEGTVERDVVAALDDAPFLSERLVEVLVRAAAYYLVPPGELLRAAVPARLLAAGEAVYVPTSGTVTARLNDRANWSNICGQNATDTIAHPGPNCVGTTDPAVSPYDGFTNAMANVKEIGLSFGSAGSYASGIALDGGPGTFTMTNFTVTP